MSLPVALEQRRNNRGDGVGQEGRLVSGGELDGLFDRERGGLVNTRVSRNSLRVFHCCMCAAMNDSDEGLNGCGACSAIGFRGVLAESGWIWLSSRRWLSR